MGLPGKAFFVGRGFVIVVFITFNILLYSLLDCKVIFKTLNYFVLLLSQCMFCLHVSHACLLPIEARRGHQFPGNWNYMWVVGMTLAVFSVACAFKEMAFFSRLLNMVSEIKCLHCVGWGEAVWLAPCRVFSWWFQEWKEEHVVLVQDFGVCSILNMWSLVLQGIWW